MKNDDIYRKFDEVYKKNWMAYKNHEEYVIPIWEIGKIISVVLLVVFFNGIIYCHVVGELFTEGILCLSVLLVTAIVYSADRKIYAKEYSFAEKNRIKCVETTICELLNCTNRDVQKTKIFIEKFDEASKKTISYRVFNLFSRVVSSFLVFYAFILAETVDYNCIPYPFAGLVMIFVLQEIFHSKKFNSLFKYEGYYQKLVRRYKDKMIEEYLNM